MESVSSIQNTGFLKQTSGNNALMIISMMFAGILFFIFILFGFYIFNFLFSIDLYSNIFKGIDFIYKFKEYKIAVTIILTLIFYSVGFLNYCLSLPFISLTAYFLFDKFGIGKKFLCKNYNEYQGLIIDDALSLIFNNNQNSLNIILRMPLSYKIGCVYLSIRSTTNHLSSEMKFLFNQVMFARTALFSISLSFFIFFLLSFRLSSNDIIICFIAFLFFYFLSISIYIFTICFFCRTLTYSYFILHSIDMNRIDNNQFILERDESENF